MLHAAGDALHPGSTPSGPDLCCCGCAPRSACLQPLKVTGARMWGAAPGRASDDTPGWLFSDCCTMNDHIT